jgi:hypothetical protein
MLLRSFAVIADASIISKGQVLYNNNNKIFIYTDEKDRSVNYIDWLVSIGDQCITSVYTIT